MVSPIRGSLSKTIQIVQKEMKNALDVDKTKVLIKQLKESVASKEKFYGGKGLRHWYSSRFGAIKKARDCSETLKEQARGLWAFKTLVGENYKNSRIEKEPALCLVVKCNTKERLLELQKKLSDKLGPNRVVNMSPRPGSYEIKVLFPKDLD